VAAREAIEDLARRAASVPAGRAWSPPACRPRGRRPAPGAARDGCGWCRSGRGRRRCARCSCRVPRALRGQVPVLGGHAGITDRQRRHGELLELGQRTSQPSRPDLSGLRPSRRVAGASGVSPSLPRTVPTRDRRHAPCPRSVRHTGHRSSLRWPRAWRSCGAAAAAMAAFRRSGDPYLLESAVAPRPALPDGRPRRAPRPRRLRDPTRARRRVRRHRQPAASHPWRAIAITELLLDSPP
jgi:hypothetical protein